MNFKEKNIEVQNLTNHTFVPDVIGNYKLDPEIINESVQHAICNRVSTSQTQMEALRRIFVG